MGQSLFHYRFGTAVVVEIVEYRDFTTQLPRAIDRVGPM